VVSSVVHTVSKIASGVVHAVSSAVHKAVSAVKHAIKTVVTKVKAAYHKVVKAAKSAYHKVVKTVKSAVKKVVNTVKKTAKYVAAHAANALKRTFHVVRFVINMPATAIGFGLAEATGGSCGMAAGLMVVCGGSSIIPSGRAGFTIGNVYMYGSDAPDADALSHESNHSTQYMMLGGGVIPFAPMYFLSMGTSWVDYQILGPRHDSQGLVCTTATACYNIFEMGADLHKGHYFHAP
jgi:hypothetical protein